MTHCLVCFTTTVVVVVVAVVVAVAVVVVVVVVVVAVGREVVALGVVGEVQRAVRRRRRWVRKGMGSRRTIKDKQENSRLFETISARIAMHIEPRRRGTTMQ